MVFVFYSIKANDPWAKGTRVDSTAPVIVPIGTPVELPFWQEFAVMAVPRALAEKAKGGASDPAWLEPSASGVIRVPGTFQVPSVFRDIVLRFRLEKEDKGLKLVLLNKEDLKAAQQEPSAMAAEIPKSQPSFLMEPLFLWGLVVGGGLGLIVGVCLSWRLKRSVVPSAEHRHS
jgi:hypothetical protein